MKKNGIQKSKCISSSMFGNILVGEDAIALSALIDYLSNQSNPSKHVQYIFPYIQQWNLYRPLVTLINQNTNVYNSNISSIINELYIQYRNTYPEDSVNNTDNTGFNRNTDNEIFNRTLYNYSTDTDKSCPPQPDMSQYIKKSEIPCWGCNIP